MSTYSSSAVVVSASHRRWCLTGPATDPSLPQASLFVATEATLLTLVKTETNPANRSTQRSVYQGMLLTSYAAMMFSACAVIASIGLIDRLGTLEFRNHINRGTPQFVNGRNQSNWNDGRVADVVGLECYLRPRDQLLAKMCMCSNQTT